MKYLLGAQGGDSFKEFLKYLVSCSYRTISFMMQYLSPNSSTILSDDFVRNFPIPYNVSFFCTSSPILLAASSEMNVVLSEGKRSVVPCVKVLVVIMLPGMLFVSTFSSLHTSVASQLSSCSSSMFGLRRRILMQRGFFSTSSVGGGSLCFESSTSSWVSSSSTFSSSADVFSASFSSFSRLALFSFSSLFLLFSLF